MVIFDTMAITLPEDKKALLKKEIDALTEKMSILMKFEEKVKKIEDFCQNLECFDNTSKSLDDWMNRAANELDNIKNHSHQMVPEDRVAVCMELQEDIAAKVIVIEESIAKEQELLPQGDSVPKEAMAHKEELARIHKFTLDLQAKVKQETANFSEDVKFWAEYKTGIKAFTPWLESAETAAKRMITHQEADDQVAALKERYNKVKKISDEWMKKVETLVKEWKLLDSTVCELNDWVAKDKTAEGENQFSLEKMESTLCELKNIFKEKERLVDNL